MLWIAFGMSLIGTILLVTVMRRKGPPAANELGSVSDHWIAQHRADSP
jgi:hypothetical protein